MALLPKDLREFLAPFRLLINKHALALVYRTLELSPDRIVGCSAYGTLEVYCELGIDATMYVDAATFMALVDSLPQDEDFDLINLDGTLAWGCGTAKGKMALVALPAGDMVHIDRRQPRDGWATSAYFAACLRMGAISCGSSTLSTVGMHGVVIFNRDKTSVATSDNITVSVAALEDVMKKMPEVVTLAPNAAALLAACIDSDGKLTMDATSVYYVDHHKKLLLKQVAPLKHDLLSIMGKFGGGEIVAAIPRDRIGAFIKRTAALAETKKAIYVTLHADDGQLAISFADSLAGTDEFYLVDGLKLPEGLEIKLDATKLARALAHVDEVVLDHVDKGAVIFRGHKPEFSYLVSGSKG